jgi:hypothetical protein
MATDPLASPVDSAAADTRQRFEQGLEAGKQWAQNAASGFARWAETSPEQVILAGLVTGFILGKVMFGGSSSSD